MIEGEGYFSVVSPARRESRRTGGWGSGGTRRSTVSTRFGYTRELWFDYTKQGSRERETPTIVTWTNWQWLGERPEWISCWWSANELQVRWWAVPGHASAESSEGGGTHLRKGDKNKGKGKGEQRIKRELWHFILSWIRHLLFCQYIIIN